MWMPLYVFRTLGKPHQWLQSELRVEICASSSPSRENTVLRAALVPSTVYVIPNALIADQFQPATEIVSRKPRGFLAFSTIVLF